MRDSFECEVACHLATVQMWQLCSVDDMEPVCHQETDDASWCLDAYTAYTMV